MHSSVKHSVDLHGIRPEMAVAHAISVTVFMELGYACIITSACDGTHGRSSRHYSGLALDFRTRHIPRDKHGTLSQRLSEALGPQFDVVLEGTHIHIEFDPKTPT